MEADSPLRRRKRPMAEINVVPYIDVMLVLLIIFMVTAPLLNLGVEVELPQGNAESMGDIDEPLMVTVDRDGNLYLNTGDAPELVDPQTLAERVGIIVGRNPDVQVLVGGDQQTDYRHIYGTMVTLQQAGVASIGFMGDPPEQ
ncbi:ExbD/TolR family protein [Wenzhouxiangella sp. XN79A]|uniref:ExbD/TolR family protein n=1 Tax=Wenzhouxiangella sp. XN79A TaxID=2724193 RepID=UPI00144A968B|nr:ExbD/TolR family protein [Wenzhouxiangella sp. XN79A]NKI35503.1 ExbD/TolR family protein [Wenzhouxiangella sp. XN79A]